MSEGFSIVKDVFGFENPGMATAVAVVIGTGALCIYAANGLKNRQNKLVPEPYLNSTSLLESISCIVVQIGDDVMGKENRRFLPFCASIFFYLFFMNLIGLIPGFLPPTEEFQLNLGLALVVFSMYNFWGIRENGVINYFKHFCGPIIWIAPFMFVIELISHCCRPLTLSLRIFGNLTGDHLALSTFTSLTKVFSFPFYMLGTLVCVIQAFVFTLLTMVYIKMSVAHSEAHADDH